MWLGHWDTTLMSENIFTTQQCLDRVELEMPGFGGLIGN